MNSQNLKEFQSSDFDSFYKLMSEAFPSEERRNYEEQKKLLNEDAYSITSHKDDNENITAFIASWEFDDFVFIEHFAVSSKIRGNGMGTLMIKDYLSKCNKPIFLEVEPPENDISMRRIEFYKRLGFHLNDYDYLQPPLQKQHDFLPLKIMSYPQMVDNKEFIDFRNLIYDKIYKVKLVNKKIS